MIFDLDFTESQADELLIAITHRCKQAGISKEKEDELIYLGKTLSRKFESEFKWKDYSGKPRKVFEYYMSKKITIRIRG